MPSSACAGCHAPGTAISPERVHWNQNEENAAKYKMNIESAVYDPAARVVNVKYFLSDPTNGNAAYNLVTSDCTGSGTTLACANTTRFGNLRFYLAYQNMVGQPAGVTEFSAYNNGGSGANAFAYKGTNDGSNHYTVADPGPGRRSRHLAGRRQCPRRQHRPDQGAQAAGEVHRRSAAGSDAARAGQRGGPAHLRGPRPVGHAAATPHRRRQREMQRLPRRAGHHVRLQHAGRGIPRRCAQHRWKPASSATTRTGCRRPS